MVSLFIFSAHSVWQRENSFFKEEQDLPCFQSPTYEELLILSLQHWAVGRSWVWNTEVELKKKNKTWDWDPACSRHLTSRTNHLPTNVFSNLHRFYTAEVFLLSHSHGNYNSGVPLGCSGNLTKMCIFSMGGSRGNEPWCQCHVVCGACTQGSQRAWLIKELNLWWHATGCCLNVWHLL